MSTYTLRSIAKRGTLFGAVAALVTATIAPASFVFADSLNPLTDRSLTLSSSSPGWDFKDGSGNVTYAQPNSGANGQKTGNTFSFKVSTNSTVTGTNQPVKAMTFQYCTTSAGNCMGPGDNGHTGTTPSIVRDPNDATSIAAKTSDLEIATSSPSEIAGGSFGTYVDSSTGEVKAIPAANSTGNNFMVYYRTSDNGTPNNPSDDTWTSSTGWTMTSSEAQWGTEGDGKSTAKHNQIELVNTTGQGFLTDQMVKVVFFATDSNYITNPGSGAFFVKINTFNSDSSLIAANVIDGGVTVANVMNQSIQITTKVLETMQFSVGTVDPNTLDSTGGVTSELHAANGNSAHGPCDPVVRGMTADTSPSNTLQLGDSNGEFSLDTNKTYSTHSYWRLSSNSSAGATVYYAGQTLSNTVGDQIDAIGPTKAAPLKGKEQFGLAITNGNGSTIDLDTNADTVADAPSYAVNYTVERGNGTVGDLENGADNTTNGVHATTLSEVGANASYHTPRLYPLVPLANYNEGAGVVNANYAAPTTPVDTQFAFDTTSNTIPVAIATEDQQVVDCVTAKMRYIANIAAITPAGIYTTKVNYIAAPQY